KYLVLPTDKNLGSAVVSREWYLEKCGDILRDRTSYSRVMLTEVDRLPNDKRSLIIWLARHGTWPGITEQQRKWLVHRLPNDEVDPYEGVPRFYGIPKIHKSPWKMRPIVPCHSAMQNPAAKVLSFLLKPIVQTQPYILEGSKQLAMRLDQLRLPPGKKVWII